MKAVSRPSQFVLAAAILAGAAGAAPAADRYWVGASTFWDLTSGWSTTDHGVGGASVPVNGDNVYIDPVGTSVQVIRDNATPSYTSPGLYTLTLNGTGGAVAAINQLTGNALYAGTLTVGGTGTGQYLLNGGTAGFTNLVIAAQAGSAGTFSVSGSTSVLSATTVYVGAVPSSGATLNATYNQSGGSATFNTFSVSASPNAIANGNFGGGVMNAGSFYTGSDGGAGTFTQTGGTLTSNNYGYVGHNSGGTGVYNLSGGVASFKYFSLADSNGEGTLNIGAGTFNATNASIGGWGSGKIVLTGGALNIGTMSMNGSNTQRATSIYANNGTFTLGLGTASVATINGTNTVTVTGSNRFVMNNTNLNVNGGTFNLDTTAPYTALNGASLTVQNGGQFNALNQDFYSPVTLLSGGALNVTGYHAIGAPTVLNGGILSAEYLYTNNPSLLTFNAGTISQTSSGLFYVDPNYGGGCLFASLTLDANKALAVNTGVVYVAGGGVLNLSGGTLTCGGLDVGGTFNYTAGTLRLTGRNINVGDGGLFGATATIGSNYRLETTGSNQIIVNNNSLVYMNGGTFNAAGGYVNNGEVLLASPLGSINGGTFTNAGLLDGSGRINSSLANGATGTVRIASNDRIAFNGAANSNAGTIQLLGGIAEFKGALTNNKTIAGRGSLFVNGGLTNNGTLLFASGPAEVFGNVTNSATAKVLVTGGADATFYNNVTSNAATSFKVDSGSVLSILGAVNGGTFGGAGTVVFQAQSAPAAIAGSGAAIVESGASVSVPSLTENSLTLRGPLVLSGNKLTSKVQSLDIAVGSTLDLKTNKLIVDYTGSTPLATIRGELLSGQIIATTNDGKYRVGYAEASEIGASAFGGAAIDSSSLLLTATIAGDANLDGRVDVADLGQLASAWQKTNRDWFNGDFNYDGLVNVVDLGTLASNWQGGVSFAAALATVNLGGVAVPEPTMMGLLALGGVLLRRRGR